MAKAYYGSRISKNMTLTPEGFLICHNVPIARTGTQQYLARELGLDNKSDGLVTVYRDEADVFDKKTLASFEGKIFTDEHPSGWVTPENANVYIKGVIANVRRGEGGESDLLLADIIVHSRDTIDEIQGNTTKQKREVSCGYECNYVPFREGYKQKDIVGNHVSLVDAGRAGERVAIKDSDKLLIERSNTKMSGQYKIPTKNKSSVKDFLVAVGLKHVVTDAEPEDILNMVDEMTEEKMAEKAKEQDADPIVTETEYEDEPTTDEGDDRYNELAEKVDHALDLIKSLIDGSGEETEDDEEVDPDMQALDDLEEEIAEGEGDPAGDQMEEEESVTVDPEDINETEDEDPIYNGEEAAAKATDSARALIKQFKPIIASMPKGKDKTKATDALIKEVRKLNRVAKDSKQNPYAALNNRPAQAKDKAADGQKDTSEYGKDIAAKWNPHYKKN